MYIRIFKQYMSPLLIGAFVMALYACYITNIGLPSFISGHTVRVAMLEEVLKLGTGIFLIYVLKLTPGRIILSSAGFGLYEQLEHLTYSIGTFSFVPIVMHTVSGLVMAHFLLKAFQDGHKRHKYVFYALLGGISVHAVYNILPSVTLKILYVVLFGFLVGI